MDLLPAPAEDRLLQMDLADAVENLRDHGGDDLALLELHVEGVKQADLASLLGVPRSSAGEQVRKVEEQIAKLSRQAATRTTAARRAARIARTGAAFRSPPTPSEAWIREALQSDPITRTPASLTAGLLRSLQSTRSGLSARRPRFYGARRDAEGDRLGKPCGESNIPKAHKCHKGTGVADAPCAGPNLTPANIHATAVGASAAAAVGAYA